MTGTVPGRVGPEKEQRSAFILLLIVLPLGKHTHARTHARTYAHTHTLGDKNLSEVSSHILGNQYSRVSPLWAALA